MFRTKCFSIGIRAALLLIVMMMFLPVNSFAQRRRWVVERSPRSRIVVYQPRPYVVYQRRPNYTYQYQTYSYPQPYYANQYYAYQYSQPYFANRYTYSWANPTYRYDVYGYQPRHRHNRVRIWWR